MLQLQLHWSNHFQRFFFLSNGFINETSLPSPLFYSCWKITVKRSQRMYPENKRRCANIGHRSIAIWVRRRIWKYRQPKHENSAFFVSVLSVILPSSSSCNYLWEVYNLECTYTVMSCIEGIWFTMYSASNHATEPKMRLRDISILGIHKMVEG